MGEDSTSWLEAAPAAVVLLLLVFVPGWVALRLLGLRGLAALTVAPVLSVTTIALTAVGASLLGVRWGAIPLLGGSLLSWLAAAALARLLRSAPAPAPGPVAPTLLAVGIAAAQLLVVMVPLTGAATASPQQPDTIFHLGTIQWMLDRGDISSLEAGGFTTLSGEGFYPAAFHGVAATLTQLTGQPIVVSTSLLAFVAAGVSWPLGCLLLARLVLGPSLAVSLAVGLTSGAFTAFPLWLMGYGVLWPNLLGYALLPAVLGCLVAAVARGPAAVIDRPRASVLLATTVPGLALAHPNALIALVVFGYPVVAERLLATAWRHRRERPSVAAWAASALVSGTLLLLAIGAVLTRGAVGMRGSNEPGPETSLGKAVNEALFHAPRGAPHLRVLGVLVLAGVVAVVWRHRDQLWVAVTFVLTAVLFVAVMAVDSPRTRLLTWPWYNNAPRIAALVVLPAVLAAAAALVAVAARLDRVRAARGGPGWWPAFVGPVVLLVLTGGYVDQHRRVMRPYFPTSSSRAYDSGEQLDGLRLIGERIPKGSVVAANPWNGASYLYLVSGHRLLFPTEQARWPTDRALLAQRLNEAGRSDEVCAAARRERVQYVITGGQPVGDATNAPTRYAGVDGVAASAAFRQIAAHGPYRLYQLVGCAA